MPKDSPGVTGGVAGRGPLQILLPGSVGSSGAVCFSSVASLSFPQNLGPSPGLLGFASVCRIHPAVVAAQADFLTRLTQMLL